MVAGSRCLASLSKRFSGLYVSAKVAPCSCNDRSAELGHVFRPAGSKFKAGFLLSSEPRRRSEKAALVKEQSPMERLALQDKANCIWIRSKSPNHFQLVIHISFTHTYKKHPVLNDFYNDPNSILLLAAFHVTRSGTSKWVAEVSKPRPPIGLH